MISCLLKVPLLIFVGVFCCFFFSAEPATDRIKPRPGIFVTLFPGQLYKKKVSLIILKKNLITYFLYFFNWTFLTLNL